MISLDWVFASTGPYMNVIEEINIILSGVHYFDVIASTQLRENPNDDIGNIELVETISPEEMIMSLLDDKKILCTSIRFTSIGVCKD